MQLLCFTDIDNTLVYPFKGGDDMGGGMRAIADAWQQSDHCSYRVVKGGMQQGTTQQAALQEGQERCQQCSPLQQGTREVRLMPRSGGRCWHTAMAGRLLPSYQQQLLAGGHDPDTARLQAV